jgi:methylated-DNA-[protein]-cysteine S-methyltransferase
MTDEGFALFDTAIGTCGLAWNGRGISSVQLPERTASAIRTRLMRQRPQATEQPPPPDVAAAIDGMTAVLAGRRVDLSEVAVDWDQIPDFNRRVYEVARSIPSGKTLTYGEVAAGIGEPGAGQAVGQALGRNPVPIVVPCHRVLAAGGQMGGFSAPGGAATKRRMLVIEGALPDAPTLF